MGRRHGSRQQEAIYEYLCSTREHPTAETVYHALRPAFPSLSLGTVYRALGRLCDEGRAKRLPFPVERYDANTAPHPHFACRRCGRVLDLPVPDAAPQAELNAVRDGYAVERCEVVCCGLCRDCAAAPAEAFKK